MVFELIAMTIQTPAREQRSLAYPSPRGQGRSEAQKNGIKSFSGFMPDLDPLTAKALQGHFEDFGEVRLGWPLEMYVEQTASPAGSSNLSEVFGKTDSVGEVCCYSVDSGA